MKPGYKTTEYWMSVATALVGLMVALGVLEPEGADSPALLKIVGGGMAGVASLGYSLARGLAKLKL